MRSGSAPRIAGVGGVLIGFRRPSVVFYPTFSVFQSILVVLYAVIGGIGYVIGALVGAVLAPGAIVPYAFGDLFDSAQAVQLTLGIVVFGVLLVVPNGLASLVTKLRLGMQRSAGLEPAGRPTISPKTLEAEGVRVRFGVVDALDGVSITVRPREVLGLIGPNGAGKSTLIDALTGFAKPAAGQVLLDGVDITGWSARKRAVAGVGRSFQSLELFDGMTVRENLRTAADKRDWLAYFTDLVHPGKAPLERATASAVVQEFGLEDDLDRRPEELSFGKRRLVALARAVATEPSVLLLDEPAAGLGEHETAELGHLVRRLAEDWGMAVLLVEHDVSLVLGVCDRVSVLDFGRVIAHGDPEAIGQLTGAWSRHTSVTSSPRLCHGWPRWPRVPNRCSRPTGSRRATTTSRQSATSTSRCDRARCCSCSGPTVRARARRSSRSLESCGRSPVRCSGGARRSTSLCTAGPRAAPRSYRRSARPSGPCRSRTT